MADWRGMDSGWISVDFASPETAMCTVRDGGCVLWSGEVEMPEGQYVRFLTDPKTHEVTAVPAEEPPAETEARQDADPWCLHGDRLWAEKGRSFGRKGVRKPGAALSRALSAMDGKPGF